MFIAALFAVAELWNNLSARQLTSGQRRCGTYTRNMTSHQKEGTLPICDSTDEPKEPRARYSRSDRGGQMLCDFTHTWHLNNIINE